MAQFGFVYDALKCVGCSACAVACKTENNTPVGVRYRRVVTQEIGTFAGTGANEVRRVPTSMACYHCTNPACVEACPTGACAKEANFGLVRIDQNVCVGCRRCVAACPYGAPAFNATTHKTEKCTGCYHRIVDTSGSTPALKDGIKPACVAACPSRALRFEVRDTAWGSGTPPPNFYDTADTTPSVDFD